MKRKKDRYKSEWKSYISVLEKVMFLFEFRNIVKIS